MLVFNSRYNFSFLTSTGVVLYNSKTAGSIMLSGTHSETLLQHLLGDKKVFKTDVLTSDLTDTLLKNGFILDLQTDEVSEIREKYWKARGETPLVLTITTTQDCNLGCYYCYENRTKDKLEFDTIDKILKLLDSRLGGKKSLHVDWYGGEPLLNISFLEAASLAIQEYCKERKLNYHASVISNGTLWPSDLATFISMHKIREVQISFDGLRENHNKRRRYTNLKDNGLNSSFDEAIHLVDKLLDIVSVDVRFNLDDKNKVDILPFIDYIKERDWFAKRFPVIFQPARISAYTEKTSFLSSYQLLLEEFDEIRMEVRQKLNGSIAIEESEVPDGFPYPKNYVCAALADSSFVVGADKLIYRCGLQVGERLKAVGSIGGSDNSLFADKTWWEKFDPCLLPSCSKCSFLPVCWGGCPKKHLDADEHALKEQSAYWRKNLALKVTGFLGLELLEVTELSEKDQFRQGYDLTNH